MRSIQAIIDAKFLSLCPAPDAVAWLKEKRQGVPTDTLLLTDDHTYEEEALAGRNDPYIDFGLARYGISEVAAGRSRATGARSPGASCRILITNSIPRPSGAAKRLLTNSDWLSAQSIWRIAATPCISSKLILPGSGLGWQAR